MTRLGRVPALGLRLVAAAALWLAFASAPALAGCGQDNPNCIVPTAPFGTSDNRAASTKFVQQALGTQNLNPGTSLISPSTNGGVLFDNNGVLGDSTTLPSGLSAANMTLTTPTLGAATATSVNGLTISTTTGVLSIANGKTLTDTSGVGTNLLLGAAGGGFSAYGGASCSNQFLNALSAAGVGTCASVVNADLTAGSFTNITGVGALSGGSLASGFTAVTGPLGGTGLTTAAIGDMMYASATTPTWARLADVAVGAVLVSGGVSTAPAYSNTLPATVQGNITALGTIVSGVWQGTAIGASYLPAANNGSSVSGIMIGDGTTITCSAGVCSSLGGTATSFTVGTTTIISGAAGEVLYQNGASPTGTVGEVSGVTSNGTAMTFGNGDLILSGSSSGTETLEVAATASGVITFPAATDTVDLIGTAQTFTAIKTFTNSDIRELGSSTGYTTITSGNAGGSNYTWTIPASTDTFAGLTVVDQTLSGGANLTVYAAGSSSFTVDCGKNPGQYVANTGAITITAPASDGACDVQLENGSGAGAITWSGFTEGSNTGDALDTTNGHKFLVGVTRIHGTSHYLISALQ